MCRFDLIDKYKREGLQQLRSFALIALSFWLADRFWNMANPAGRISMRKSDLIL